MNPLMQLLQWVIEERDAGIPFSHGAVLGTVGCDGKPKTRLLGVHFDEGGIPRFHTSPSSRKVADIAFNRHASITFAFQKSLRSVSLEGILEEIPRELLIKDWLTLEPEFRRSYLVFGHRSGEVIFSDMFFEKQRQELPPHAENEMPPGFIGYRFANISRIAFYSIGSGHFAQHEIFTHDALSEKEWLYTRTVP